MHIPATRAKQSQFTNPGENVITKLCHIIGSYEPKLEVINQNLASFGIVCTYGPSILTILLGPDS